MDWIRGETNPARRGYTVARLVPPRYESYCKILHPIYLNTDSAVPDETWDAVKAEVLAHWIDEGGSSPVAESLMRDAHVIKVTAGSEYGGPRLRWQTLATALGLELTAGIHDGSFFAGSWPQALFGPEEGDLPPDHISRLVKLLDSPQPHHFFYEAYTPPALENDGEESYVGALEELPTLVDQEQFAPSYWWPEDRSWCLCLDWDLSFTVVGGSHEMVERLANDDVLECVRVAATDRYMDTRAPVLPSRMKRLLRRRGML